MKEGAKLELQEGLEEELDDAPLVTEEYIERDGQDLSKKTTKNADNSARKSIEDRQELKRLQALIDDYDFDGLGDEEE